MSIDKRLKIRLSRNLSAWEFVYGTTGNVDPECVRMILELWDTKKDLWIPNLYRIANKLQVIRDYSGCPMNITSGIRPVEWEILKNRSGKSMHTEGLAGDYVLDTKNKRQKMAEAYDFTEQTFLSGGRAFSVDPLFSHLDDRQAYQTWEY